MSYLTQLLTEYNVMGGRRSDDSPLDSDDMFDFDLKSDGDGCSCSECGGDCSCEESNCSECGLQFEDDDEMGMDGGPDMGAGPDDPDMDAGGEDNGMRRRDDDHDDDDFDMSGGNDDDLDMEPGQDDDMGMEPGGDEMGGDVESRLDDLENKLTDVLQKFAQVLAKDMTSDTDGGEDDLDMEPGADDDLVGSDGDGEDDLGMDAGDDEMGGEDDLDMDAGPEKEGRGEFDMDAFDREHEPTIDNEPMGDEDPEDGDYSDARGSSINPEIRRRLDRMKDEKELARLLNSGKMPKKMSFKAARKFMQEYEDDLPDKVNQDDHDNEVDGKFNTDTYGNRDGKKRLNKRYSKHRVAD